MKTRILVSSLALLVTSTVCGCHIAQAAAPPSAKSSTVLSKSTSKPLKLTSPVKAAANVKVVSNIKTATAPSAAKTTLSSSLPKPSITASTYSSYYRRRLLYFRLSLARSKRVLEYAQKMVGKQDGNGECWTLAANALVAAGAKPANGYVFGTAVAAENARPGDIIQFNNARFEIRTATSFRWFQMGSPNHTAVIETVNGKTIGLLHQNVNGDRRVQRQTIDLNTKVSGSFIIYRAQPK